MKNREKLCKCVPFSLTKETLKLNTVKFEHQCFLQFSILLMTSLCLPQRITLTFSLLLLETGSWMATIFVLVLESCPIGLTSQVASIGRTGWWLQLLFWGNLARLSPVPFKQYTDNPIFSERSRRQETVSMLTVSGPQQTSFTHMHRHTHSPLLLLWRGGPVVIYSPCCHKPNVSCNNFHELPPSLLLFVDFSQLHRATPQPNPSPPGFRPDFSISSQVLSFGWVIWAMTSIVLGGKEKVFDCTWNGNRLSLLLTLNRI